MSRNWNAGRWPPLDKLRTTKPSPDLPLGELVALHHLHPQSAPPYPTDWLDCWWVSGFIYVLGFLRFCCADNAVVSGGWIAGRHLSKAVDLT